MKGFPWIKLGVAALGLGAIVWAAREFGLADVLNPQRIQELLASAGPLGPLALIGGMATAVVISPLPSLPIDIAAGAVFGPWLGTLYAAIGATLGSMISFGIARFLGREVVERFVGGHISFCRNCSDHLLGRIVFATRLIPFVSFDLISYGAGLTKMSLRSFTLATFFGMLPLTFLYTYSGPLLIEGGVLSLTLGAVMVVAFLLLPVAIERYDPFGMKKLFEHD